MYNTVEELHIALDQSLQNINSNRKSIIKPQEKDWLLNETQLRVIDMIMDARKAKGYEDDQLNYDMLLPVKETMTLPIVAIDEHKGYAVLPSDYLHRDSIAANVVLNCDEATTSIEHVGLMFIVPIPVDTASPAYAGFTVSIGTEVIFRLSDYGYSGFNKADSFFTIIQLMIDVLREKGLDLYWEQYNETYIPRTLFIIDNGYEIPLTGGCRVEYNGYDITTGSSSDNKDVLSNLEFQVLKDQPTSLVSTEDINDMLKHKFYTTVPDKPLITMSKHIVIVYYNADFFINEIKLRYIRMPRLINKQAGIMTELTTISDKIVQLTVQNIKAKIEDKGYQAVLNENVINN